MIDTVAEIGKVCAREGIDAGFAHDGTLTLARSAAQAARLRVELDEAHARGFTEDDLRWLDRDETAGRIRATHLEGAVFTPHCAAVHPGRLVQGLAVAAERAGATLHEQTRATSLRSGRVVTASGTVRAPYVVRATEGWTARLPGMRRTVAPVYSLMVATEPLPAAVWDEIGLTDRPTFTDGRHVIVYGQRTDDDRLVFGGRGAPYHLGSSIHPSYDSSPRVFGMLQDTLRDLLPGVGDPTFTHAWGGPLGIARDWAASVGLDRATGLAWAGGYVGDGVGTTNLAGRTLADLILRRDTDLVTLPWVGHRSPAWEPEPLRWLGINAGLWAMTAADAEEARTGRPSRIARWMAPLIHG
jgi:glycine/D-amino acid oxidase-like deaminating enzyme